MNEEYREFIKNNAIDLVKNHKEICDDPECNLSMGGIKDLLESAGFKLTPEERGIFI